VAPRRTDSDPPTKAAQAPEGEHRGSVRITLTRRRRALLVLFLLLLSATYLYSSIQTYRAARLAQGTTAEELEAAVRLQPRNAEYQFRLGSYLFLAKYWLALATLYQVTGDSGAQLEALQRATAASPNDPTVAWQAANYFLVRGETERALEQFQVVLLHDPGVAELALELCWRGTRDPARIMALLDGRPDLHLTLVRVLLEQEAPQAAATVWERLLALGLPFRMERALTYINRLIEQGDGEAAKAAWNGALALQPGMEAYRHGRNLIVNGGFDENILNGGFDWRVSQPEGMRVGVDSTEFHGGHRSMALEYQGTESAGWGLVQYVPLRPSTDYVFTAYYRTTKLAGTNAPRIYVQEHPGGSTLAASRPLEGAPVWRQEQVRFRSGPAATLAAIRVRRPAAGTVLRGTIHLDSLSLQEAGAEGRTR
jgi:tetratricopeptide (TPR) repeat protein